MSLDLFKTHIVKNTTVQSRCVSGLLILIENERFGEVIDRSLVKNLLTMLYKLQVSCSIALISVNILLTISLSLCLALSINI